MSEVICPHCGMENAAGTAFCESCGKAVSVQSTTPRVIEKRASASMAIGQGIQAKQLRQMAKKASKTLFCLAILYFLAALLFFLQTQGVEEVPPVVRLMIIAISIVGVIFLALGVWAKFHPLPASIVGLILYVSLVVTGLILSPEFLSQERAIQETAIQVLIILIIVLALAKAIAAGIRFRKLKAMMASNEPLPAPGLDTPTEG